MEPQSYDNVGIYRKHIPKLSSTLPVGEHHKSYRVYDYDGNMAECTFVVFVSTNGTDLVFKSLFTNCALVHFVKFIYYRIESSRVSISFSETSSMFK